MDIPEVIKNKPIKQYYCSDCDIFFRTDYDYGEVVCPHCREIDNLKELDKDGNIIKYD